MASKRELKKDIDLLMSLVVNDCFYVMEYNPKVDKDALMNLARETMLQHREFRKRVNHPDAKDDPKKVKQYYNDLMEKVMNTVDKNLEKLSAEVKKAA